MFESIDLQVTDEKAKSDFIVNHTQFVGCTRTGCYGTTCKWPC
jgi:hypothetical protein